MFHINHCTSSFYQYCFGIKIKFPTYSCLPFLTIYRYTEDLEKHQTITKECWKNLSQIVYVCMFSIRFFIPKNVHLKKNPGMSPA